MKKKLQRHQIKSGAAHELLVALERFVADRPIDVNEQLHFEDIPLKEYALAGATVDEETALHKCLRYLAFVEFYLYAYDDAHLDAEFLDDFREYVSWMFHEMGCSIPAGFNSEDVAVVDQARRANAELFETGLSRIVDSSFALAWERRPLLYEFNRKLASTILPLKRVDYPILAADGRLPRVARFPQWIVNAVQKRDRGTCQHCNIPVSPALGSDDGHHIDHMVALALGGGNDPTNLLLSCGPCNLTKGAKPVAIRDEFSWPAVTNQI